MKFDERAVFAAFAPVLQRLSTVQWAGARSASLGARLQRDGAVGRVRPTAELAVAVSVSDGVSHRVELSIVRQELRANCTCLEAPCAHAVAAALETARMARQAGAAVSQQNDVLAALRDRLAVARTPAREVEPPRMLSDLARLPIEAAVDMVALTWRQSVRHAPGDIQDLLNLTERVADLSRQSALESQPLALRLVQAVGARKVVFTGMPEAVDPAIATLCQLAVDRPLEPHADWSTLFDLADAGMPQVGAHLAGGLAAVAHRSAELAVILAESLTGRVLSQHSTWKEVASPTARDKLSDELSVALIRHDRLGAALELAQIWPPMRQGAIALAEALAAEGRVAEVLAALEPFDPRAETWQSAMAAAMQAALQSHPGAARDLAAYTWNRAPTLASFELMARFHTGSQWPERRHTLASRALTDDDPAWLAIRLGEEPDPVAALLPVALQWPLRERFQREALTILGRESPDAAFRLRALRVHSLVATGAASRTLKDEFRSLKDAADACGEPGLAFDLARLLVREQGDKAAWTAAAGAVFGKM